ncbi:MAG: DEAD/DEAH box helicase [Acidobacteria bacterium]|nr:DEAD/DEAH box helicase [Acidobacteriota bacterium]
MRLCSWPDRDLAEQHSRNIRRWLAGTPYRVELLTGSLKAKEKREIQEAIAEGDVDLVVGTHAVIQESVQFKRLGLAIIDEQHRFGVMQRAELHRRGINPDILVITATPIPRSLAMTVYGDLEISVIDEMPPGRTLSRPSSAAMTGAKKSTSSSAIRSRTDARLTSFIQ